MITDDDVGSWLAVVVVHGIACGFHGMAIEVQALTKLLVRVVNELRQLVVVRVVACFNAMTNFTDTKGRCVDRLAWQYQFANEAKAFLRFVGGPKGFWPCFCQ